MFSQIAQVFSSQGVVVPGSEYVAVPRKAQGACDHSSPCDCFKPKFDQAAARLELSRAGREASKQEAAKQGPVKRGADGEPLSEDEQKQVAELKKRDQEVRRHESQHMASAGGYAKGGAAFEYERGPDGQNYAVGGHVSIDAGPVSGNPEATLAKARTVQRAALAPADPSGQDRAVAAAAAQMALEAQKEVAEGKGQGDATSAQGYAAGAQEGSPEEDPASGAAAASGRNSPYARGANPASVAVGARFSAYA